MLTGVSREDRRFEREQSRHELSASPRSASMKAWLSTMPVEGDRSARCGDQRGFERARLLAAEPDEVGDAVGFRLSLERGELVDFVLRYRHQELTASLVRDAELLAERVEHRLAIDAEPRLVEARSDSRCRHE